MGCRYARSACQAEGAGGALGEGGDLTKLCSSLNVRYHPMLVMSASTCVSIDRMTPCEEAQRLGQVWSVSPGSMVAFVSHQWLSFAHPDPDGIQLSCFQVFLKEILCGRAREVMGPDSWEALSTGTLKGNTTSAVTRDAIARNAGVIEDLTPGSLAKAIAAGYIWLDYASIPQVDNIGKLNAINSIPSYVEDSTWFIVLAPRAVNKSTGLVCDFSSWRSRGWCRLEETANYLRTQAMTPIILNEEKRVRVADFADWLVLQAWNRRGGVACGEFACCRMGHVRPDGTAMTCDKHIVLDVCRQMWCGKISQMEQSGNKWGFMAYRCCEMHLLAESVDAPFHALWGAQPGSSPEKVLALVDADIAAGKTDWPAVRLVSVLGDERLLELCIKRGDNPADVNPAHGQTPIHYMGGGGSAHALRLMLAQPQVDVAFVNKRSKGLGITALDRTARCGHAELILLLVQARANVNARRDDNGQTALHAAAEHGHAQCTQVLVQYGGVDAIDHRGATPLHLCATGFAFHGDVAGKIDVAELLLRAEASCDIRNLEGRTALACAQENRCDDLAVLINASACNLFN